MKNRYIPIKLDTEYFFMNDYGQVFLYKVTKDFFSGVETSWVRFGKSGRYRKFKSEAFNILEPKLIGEI